MLMMIATPAKPMTKIKAIVGQCEAFCWANSVVVMMSPRKW
jgi:hypothetical protein